MTLNLLNTDCKQMILNFIQPSVISEKEYNDCIRVAFVNKEFLACSKEILTNCKKIKTLKIEALIIEYNREDESMSPDDQKANGCLFAAVLRGSDFSEWKYSAQVAEDIRDIVHLIPQSLHYIGCVSNMHYLPPAAACLNAELPLAVVKFLLAQKLDDAYKKEVSTQLAQIPLWSRQRYVEIKKLLDENKFPEFKKTSLI